MYMPHSRNNLPRKKPAHRHGAFTLIEMLIAIGVVLLLVGLLVSAIAPAIEGAKVTATRAIIAHLDSQLRIRLSALNTMMDTADKKDSPTERAILRIMNDKGFNKNDAKAYYRKVRYRMEFPQQVKDLTFTGTGMESAERSPLAYAIDSPLLAIVKQALNTDSYSAILNDQVSSSELLYLLLTEGHSIGSESYSIEGISSQYITDEDKDGLMEIRDAWGNEIRFYATPTALFRPDPAAGKDDNGLTPLNLELGARFHFQTIPKDNSTGELYQDPLDKLGRMAGRPQLTEANYYHPLTYFGFLIVSPGPDRELGLNEPNAAGLARHAQPLSTDKDSSEFQAMFDNITNHQK
jgi:type II secretory pathway pseudopilin PulG